MTLEVAQSGLPVLPAESLLHIAMETLQDPQEYCIPWQIPPRYPSPTSWDRKSHHKSKYPSGPVKFTCCPGNFEKGQLTFQSQPCFLNEWTTSLVNLYEVVKVIWTWWTTGEVQSRCVEVEETTWRALGSAMSLSILPPRGCGRTRDTRLLHRCLPWWMSTKHKSPKLPLEQK